MSLPIGWNHLCRSGHQVDASQSVRDSDSLHDDGWIGQRGQCLEILRVLSEHDPSGSLGDCNDDCIDGRAAPSSSSQSRSAASDGPINRFQVAHPEKSLLEKVPARIALQSLREDDRRDDRGPQAGASKLAEPLSGGNAALGQPGETSGVENRWVHALRGFFRCAVSGPVSLPTQASASAI